MNEGIAPRKPGEKIFVLDVVDRNMEMLESTCKWIVCFKLPFKNRDNVCYGTILKRFWPP